MAKVEITISNKDLNAGLAKMDPVQDKLRGQAHDIKALAEALLAMHRKTGEHRIEVGHEKSKEFGHIDWYVSLVGRAAASVEFGHRADNGRWVEGLYIITRAGLP